MSKPMTKAEKRAAYDAWYLAEIDKGLMWRFSEQRTKPALDPSCSQWHSP